MGEGFWSTVTRNPAFWLLVGAIVGVWATFLTAWSKVGWRRGQSLDWKPFPAAFVGGVLGGMAYGVVGFIGMGVKVYSEHLPNAIPMVFLMLSPATVLIGRGVGFYVGRRKAVRQATEAGREPHPRDVAAGGAMGAAAGTGIGCVGFGIYIVVWFVLSAYLMLR